MGIKSLVNLRWKFDQQFSRIYPSPGTLTLGFVLRNLQREIDFRFPRLWLSIVASNLAGAYDPCLNNMAVLYLVVVG